jgi:hypothetical protein
VFPIKIKYDNGKDGYLLSFGTDTKQVKTIDNRFLGVGQYSVAIIQKENGDLDYRDLRYVTVVVEKAPKRPIP